MIDQQLRATVSHELDEESMTNSIAPLAGADDSEASLNGSTARQRAAAVFSFPSASNAKQSTEKNEDNPMFRDIARTTLPIEFQGQELKLEAHAYEDASTKLFSQPGNKYHSGHHTNQKNHKKLWR